METTLVLFSAMIFVLMALMPTLAILYAARLIAKSIKKLLRTIK